MGQVPKNIIYAEAGTKLEMIIDGKPMQLNENQLDAIAAEERDKLIQSGHLKGRDSQLYMDAWTKWKDQARTGSYKLDTAGPNAFASLQYKGQSDNAGLGLNEEGKTASRTGVGRFLSKKIKAEDPANMMSTLNYIMGNRISGAALEEGKRLDTETKAAVDKATLDKKTAEAKLKAEQENAKKVEEAQWAQPSNLQEHINKRLSSTGTENKIMLRDLPLEDKLKHVESHFNLTYPNLKKFKNLEGVDFSSLEKYKNKETGDFNKDATFYADFYSKLYGDAGKNYINDIFGITPIAPVAPLTKEDKEKQEVEKITTDLNDNEALSNPNISKLGNNLWHIPDSEIKIPGYSFNNEYYKDPATGKLTTTYVSRPITKYSPSSAGELLGGITPGTKVFLNNKESVNAVQGNVKRYTKVTLPNGVSYLQNKNDPSDRIKIPSNKNGGIIFLQDGGTAKKSSDSGVEFLRAYKKNTAQSTEEPPSSTGTSNGTVQNKGKEPLNSTGEKAPIKKLDTSLNEADKLDIAALTLDLGSLVASFIPGGSPAAAGAGLAGTASRLGAEYARGELGWEDALPALGNAALDLTTLIPGVGVGSSALKIAKNWPRLVNIAKRGTNLLLMSYGAYEALPSGGQILYDIASGKKGVTDLSVEDYKNLMSGLQLITTGVKGQIARKSVVIDPFEASSTTGRIANKKTGIEGDAEIIKGTKGKWVPKDNTLADTHVVLRKNPWLAPSSVKGTEATLRVLEKVPGKKFDFNPETGKEYNFYDKMSPFSGIKNRYRETAAKNLKELSTPKETILTPFKGFNASKVPKKVNTPTTPVVPTPSPLPISPRTGESNVAIPKAKKTGSERMSAEKFAEISRKHQSRSKTQKTQSHKEGGIVKALTGIKLPNQNLWGTSNDYVSAPALQSTKQSDWGTSRDSYTETPSSFQQSIGDITRGRRSLMKSSWERPSLLPYQQGAVALKKSTDSKLYKTPGINPISSTTSEHKPLFDKNKVADFLRLQSTNKALRDQDTKVEAPLTTPAAETAIPVTDNLLRDMAYKRGAEMRNTAAIPMTSNAGLNYIRGLAASKQASDIEGQGDLASAQMLSANQGRANEQTQRNNVARATIAAQNAQSLARARQGERANINEVNSRISGNTDAFLASNIAENKDKDQKQLDREKQSQIEQLEDQMNIEYGDLTEQWTKESKTPGGVTPELKKRVQDMQDRKGELKAKILGYKYTPTNYTLPKSTNSNLFIHKDGGKMDKDRAKYEMDKYKERKKDSRYASQVYNRWLDKTDNRNEKNAVESTKKLTDLISKILK